MTEYLGKILQVEGRAEISERKRDKWCSVIDQIGLYFESDDWQTRINWWKIVKLIRDKILAF